MVLRTIDAIAPTLIHAFHLMDTIHLMQIPADVPRNLIVAVGVAIALNLPLVLLMAIVTLELLECLVMKKRIAITATTA